MAKDKTPKDSKSLTDLHTIHTYEFLFTAAHMASVDADEAEEDEEVFEYTERFIYCMTAIMFCAFALEAYLNHLSAIRFPKALWKNLESKLSPETKLDLIARDMNFTPNKGERPFQTFSDIIAFRNALAHGKTHKASEPVFVDEAEPAKYEKPWWMTFCTLENAEKCRKDTRAMIFALHKAAGIEVVALETYGASLPMRWKDKTDEEEE